MLRTSPPEVFLGKGFLKKCSKFAGEHLCRSAISIKLQSNFIEIKLRHRCSPVNLLHIFRTAFLKSTSGGLHLSAVPIRPVISNCGMPTEKVSEFVDFHLKHIMQNGWSHIRDPTDFINKIKNLKNISSKSILATADVGVDPSISHESGLNAIKEALENRKYKSVLTSDILKMLEFLLKNNYLNLTEMLNNSCQVQQLGQNVHLTF